VAHHADSVIATVRAESAHQLVGEPSGRVGEMDELIMIAAYYPWLLWRVQRHPMVRKWFRRAGNDALTE
jgi:hypothetical protein